MKKFDFSGWATKNDLKCSDGRTIKHGAFQAQDGERIPLVWQHMYDSPSNILGHVILENRPEGVYCYGRFNNNKKSQEAKEMVRHEDLNSLSIYANNLVQHKGDVLHGIIKEVSLVVAGANPGAKIEFPVLEHGYDGNEEEAIIFSNIAFEHSDDLDDDDEDLEHADDDRYLQDIYNTFTPEQKEAVVAILAMALEDEDEDEDEDVQQEDAQHSEGGNEVKKNVFDGGADEMKHAQTLTPEQMKVIISDAEEMGSLKSAVLKHADTYGINNIGELFPDPKSVTDTPDFIKRDDSWVSVVLNGVSRSPFARIKSLTADITPDAARAKGYVTGNRKKEEVISAMKRTTPPTTIYKKQKLDRDDIVDITDFNVVAWLKSEMRMMLDEEAARAFLIGDGRDPVTQADDKINEDCIRPIYKDDSIYTHRVEVYKDSDADEVMDAIIKSRKFYKGGGNPILFTTEDFITDMLMIKDGIGRRLYKTEAEINAILRISRLVPVEVMENVVDENGKQLVAILVNLNNYRVGADKGGQIAMFDDFDIDYNQYKYLIETRCSGALIHPKSAIVIERGTTNKPTTTP